MNRTLSLHDVAKQTTDEYVVRGTTWAAVLAENEELSVKAERPGVTAILKQGRQVLSANTVLPDTNFHVYLTTSKNDSGI